MSNYVRDEGPLPDEALRNLAYVNRLSRDAEILNQLRHLPALMQLIEEMEYAYDHRDDPPVRRTPEEIAAAVERSRRPFWKRWV